MLTVGFLGGGNMAGALAGGLLAAAKAEVTIHVVDHHPEKLAALAEKGAKTHAELGAWVA